MKLYSTNLKSLQVSFEHALIEGQAPDKGLYMPVSLPIFSAEDFTLLKHKTFPEIALYILNQVLEGEIDKNSLANIIFDAYNYPVPLEQVTDNLYIMSLDRGPTASFKDFAARLMARLIQYYLKRDNKKIIILTATSGDTGSAVAHAFYGLDNVKVIVLFPVNEVSDLQRKQMTTLQKNITALAVDGKFDDCQAMVKSAFSDEELNHLNLSSANSINIGRLIPQSLYYIYAYSQLCDYPQDIIFSIPSGNFGNMMGCVLAREMGLPVKKIIASVNENNEFPVFLNTGVYEKIVPSINCLSNAMNVGHPSNLARLIAIYGGQMDEQGNIIKMPDIKQLNADIYSTSVSDQETIDVVKNILNTYNILIEPHGAVGIKGLYDYRASTEDPTLAISLETAHPAKFPKEVQSITGINPPLPASLEELEYKQEKFANLANDYFEFKKYLLEKL